MTLRVWHWLLLVLALVVPLQAVALDEGGGGVSVSASLGVCGVAETGISCRIDVSWSGVEGAERYTASATLADGSVRDLGTVGIGSGGGSTSVWVPYTGDGTYRVTITAWGSEDDKEKKLEDGEAKLEADDTGKAVKPAEPEPAEDGEDESDGGQPPDDEPPATEEPPAEPEPEPAPVPIPEPEPEPEPEPVPGTDTDEDDEDERGPTAAFGVPEATTP